MAESVSLARAECNRYVDGPNAALDKQVISHHYHHTYIRSYLLRIDPLMLGATRLVRNPRMLWRGSRVWHDWSRGWAQRVHVMG